MGDLGGTGDAGNGRDVGEPGEPGEPGLEMGNGNEGGSIPAPNGAEGSLISIPLPIGDPAGGQGFRKAGPHAPAAESANSDGDALLVRVGRAEVEVKLRGAGFVNGVAT
jgi:hypothetical protein